MSFLFVFVWVMNDWCMPQEHHRWEWDTSFYAFEEAVNYSHMQICLLYRGTSMNSCDTKKLHYEPNHIIVLLWTIYIRILMMHFQSAELKARHTSHLAQYNHTLATILVEYASAVSSFGHVQPLIYYVFFLIMDHWSEIKDYNETVKFQLGFL
jgi:hypothetical protein